MFEILKALRDLNTACTAHGTRLSWNLADLNGDGTMPILKAEVGPLSDDDVAFIEGMQAMFAPREG